MQQPSLIPMARTATRDPNLDHPAVLLYREIVHLTPNHQQRVDIVVTVGPEGEYGLKLYEAVLRRFMGEGRPPKRVDWTLDRYEEALRRK